MVVTWMGFPLLVSFSGLPPHPDKNQQYVEDGAVPRADSFKQF
jgi:hypothetical protein